MSEQAAPTGLPVREQWRAFWLGWVAANTAGGVVVGILGAAISFTATVLGETEPFIGSMVPSTVANIIETIVTWSVIGVAQWLFLRRYFLHVNDWIVNTAVDGIGGEYVGATIANSLLKWQPAQPLR